MSAFETRVNKGIELQDFFINYLKENGIDYFLSGYEYLTGTTGARDKIKKTKDKTSLFIRHYPDVSIVRNISVLVEIKNSSGIEKDCYNNYLSLKKDLNINVLLFLKNKMLCKIEELKLNTMKEYDSKSGLIIPVTEGIWREPRLMSNDDYYKYIKAYNGKTSGSSFGFINFNDTPFFKIDNLLLL